jgi:hypothetical protein
MYTGEGLARLRPGSQVRVAEYVVRAATRRCIFRAEFIGCEFSSIYRKLGSEVTLIEKEGWLLSKVGRGSRSKDRAWAIRFSVLVAVPSLQVRDTARAPQLAQQCCQRASA